MRSERTARKLLVRCVNITIQQSKVQVSGIVSNINKVLVKDRVSYDLHNLREIIII